MAIRKFHDKLGFCAKGTLEKGGLCVGAIFRTTAFIALPQAERCGARAAQTVHIEHTVPVNVLAGKLNQFLDTREATSANLLAWLLKHSVTTAMRKGQDRQYLTAVTRSTVAFTSGSPDEGRPFARYSELFAAGETVWDVWNGREVNPEEFTFEHHFRIVLDILRASGADMRFIQALERAG